MYNYYYMKTDCRSNCWDTYEILDFLQSFDFLTYDGKGSFHSQKPFLDITLLKVKDINSWNNNDFNEELTNYISIVTSCFSENEIIIKELFKELELFLGWRICPDNI